MRDQFWGQGIMTLFGRPAKQGDSGLVPQRTILPELEFEYCKAIILQLKNFFLKIKSLNKQEKLETTHIFINR